VPLLGGERGLSLCNDDRETVRHHVVQVSPDPGPLGSGGQRDPLMLLALQVRGALFEGAQVRLVAAGARAERVGERQSRPMSP
jgi:hypothetical protein